MSYTYRSRRTLTEAKSALLPLIREDVEQYGLLTAVLQRDGHIYVSTRHPLTQKELRAMGLEREITVEERANSREHDLLVIIDAEENPNNRTR